MSTQGEPSNRVVAVQQLRSSGASGTHQDKRTKRQRTRQAQRDTAIEDSE